jgi:carboxylesterase
MSKLRSILQISFRVLLVIAGVLVVAVLLLSSAPDPLGSIPPATPAVDYDAALERIQALRADEGDEYHPDCRLKFMDHGWKTERVIVFLHGYTNCPEQFRQLGELFFEQGYNVLITPQPHMGLADRMNHEHERLTAEELAAYTSSVIDIAQGLGEHVSLVGLSGGGVMAAWAAQERSDLDLAVVIAPSFGYTFIPDFLTAPALNLFRRLPNFYQWWDPVSKSNIEPDYGYPRFATRALADILRLAYWVRDAACRETPAAEAILVITNAGDIAVDNVPTDNLVHCWRQQGYQPLSTYQFDASLKLEHDLIDPSQKNQHIDIVYPQLVELITDAH